MSRSTASAVATSAFALLATFVLIAVLTGEPGWVLWTVLPLALIGGYFTVVVRGETLGARKRERDELIAERKQAARAARAG